MAATAFANKGDGEGDSNESWLPFTNPIVWIYTPPPQVFNWSRKPVTGHQLIMMLTKVGFRNHFEVDIADTTKGFEASQPHSHHNLISLAPVLPGDFREMPDLSKNIADDDECPVHAGKRFRVEQKPTDLAGLLIQRYVRVVNFRTIVRKMYTHTSTCIFI